MQIRLFVHYATAYRQKLAAKFAIQMLMRSRIGKNDARKRRRTAAAQSMRMVYLQGMHNSIPLVQRAGGSQQGQIEIPIEMGIERAVFEQVAG
jgi:hypothetical protein